MHRSEARERDQCVDCGAEVAALDRVYSVSDETDLCFACAVRRGGQWDEAHDGWSRPPEIADIVQADAVGR